MIIPKKLGRIHFLNYPTPLAETRLGSYPSFVYLIFKSDVFLIVRPASCFFSSTVDGSGPSEESWVGGLALRARRTFPSQFKPGSVKRKAKASFYSVGGSQRCQSIQCTGVDESGGFMGRQNLAQKARGWESGWAIAQRRCEVKDLKQVCRQRQMWRLSWISAALLILLSSK